MSAEALCEGGPLDELGKTLSSRLQSSSLYLDLKRDIILCFPNLNPSATTFTPTLVPALSVINIGNDTVVDSWIAQSNESNNIPPATLNGPDKS